ncbi:glycoside hydrolase family 9 protein [Poriferisphaera sp. WC338]|uniref:glycoside hydrolase family 9 protein n=1 Tax=Poriferisphaera sp. WC338 TaxID=3425129 RepID=UPI003D816B68
MTTTIRNILISALLIFSSSVGNAADYADFPEDLIGQFPMEQPEYRGVDQVLILSNRWVIVATKNVDDVVNEINKLSNNSLNNLLRKWDESLKVGRKDWVSYKESWAVRDKFISQARENTGERDLDNPDYYTISSSDDSQYTTPLSPMRATRLLVSLGGKEIPGSHDIDYAHYSYLELPKAMQSGKHYTIRLKNKKQVRFLYDEKKTVARSIKVNQVGYLASAKRKYAYLGCYLFEFGALDCSHAKTFEVIDVSSGETVYRGKPTLRAKSQRYINKDGSQSKTKPLISGEDVYQLDLSSIKKEGYYFISVPGIGRSWPFRISDDVYGDVFYTAMRGLYHQRGSFKLDKKYTPWSRKRYHTKPIYESEAIIGPRHGGGFASVNKMNSNQFDIIGGSIDRTKKTTQVEGGWYDAADWDRKEDHYVVVFDLLTAYEQFPEKFTDGQLNFNESGNGIPDILDEAEWGLRIWRHSQDKRGGVSGQLETWTHPKIDADVDYAFGQRTRWTSLTYAAAAAQYAQLVEPFDAKQAKTYKESALRAYEFGTNPDNALINITIHGKKNRGRGEPFEMKWSETEELNYPYLVHAKLRLFKLTKDKKFLDDLGTISRKAKKPFNWKFTHKDWSAWIYWDIINSPAKNYLSADVVNYWRDIYLKGVPVGSGTNGGAFVGKNLIQVTEAMPYRNTSAMTRELFAWGDSTTTNMNRSAFISYQMTRDKRYLDVIARNADFTLGANPMGMSWTTSLGFSYPIHIQHEASEEDEFLDPYPGITLYGITNGPRYYMFRNNVWDSPAPGGKKVSFIKEENKYIPAHRRWSAHPTLNTPKCEFTIHETTSSTIFTAACLMPEGWMPSERLKNLKPRKDELLFGYWYLP